MARRGLLAASRSRARALPRDPRATRSTRSTPTGVASRCRATTRWPTSRTASRSPARREFSIEWRARPGASRAPAPSRRVPRRPRALRAAVRRLLRVGRVEGRHRVERPRGVEDRRREALPELQPRDPEAVGGRTCPGTSAAPTRTGRACAARRNADADRSSVTPEPPRRSGHGRSDRARVPVAAGGLRARSGSIFAVAFAAFGAARLDPNARGASLGFRLLIVLPGATALWPLLLRRWLRGDDTRRRSNGTRTARRRRDDPRAAPPPPLRGRRVSRVALPPAFALGARVAPEPRAAHAARAARPAVLRPSPADAELAPARARIEIDGRGGELVPDALWSTGARARARASRSPPDSVFLGSLPADAVRRFAAPGAGAGTGRGVQPGLAAGRALARRRRAEAPR